MIITPETNVLRDGKIEIDLICLLTKLITSINKTDTKPKNKPDKTVNNNNLISNT